MMTRRYLADPLSSFKAAPRIRAVAGLTLGTGSGFATVAPAEVRGSMGPSDRHPAMVRAFAKAARIGAADAKCSMGAHRPNNPPPRFSNSSPFFFSVGPGLVTVSLTSFSLSFTAFAGSEAGDAGKLTGDSFDILLSA